MKDTFEKIKQVVEGVETDVTKFVDNNNNAAGTRVRKAMQELKTLAQELRVKVQEKKNNGKAE